MPSFTYKFYFNSAGLVTIDGQIVGRRQNTSHLPSLDGFRTGDELTLAYEGAIDVNAHGYVFGVEEFVCQKIYQQFNAPWERPNEYAGPSMSIGDIVVLHPGTDKEAAYSVFSIGFRKASVFLSPLKPQPSRWHRSGELLRNYLRAKMADGIFLSSEEEMQLWNMQ